MASSLADEITQRPHKRTGVWANDSSKSKSSTDAAPKRFSRKHISDIPNSSTENDESSDQCQTVSKNLKEIKAHTNLKSHLLKLPALNSLSNNNLALLLNEFNDESEVRENDLPWTQDFLFTELTSTLNQSD